MDPVSALCKTGCPVADIQILPPSVTVHMADKKQFAGNFGSYRGYSHQTVYRKRSGGISIFKREIQFLFLLKKHKIYYFKQRQRVYNKYCNEPRRLPVAGGLPQGHPFPGKRPAYKNEKPDLF